MQASACENEPILGSVRFGRWVHGLQPLRVTGPECAQSPLVHAVATVKIDRGPQCKNTKPGCNRKIQSQIRVVNGIAALVTTPLRLLVTSAPSDQACPAPGICLSQSMHSMLDASRRNMTTCPLGSPGAAERGPALGTRVRRSRCRGGQDLGTQWTAMDYRFDKNCWYWSRITQTRLSKQRGQTKEISNAKPERNNQGCQ